jgi:hypothetical protein
MILHFTNPFFLKNVNIIAYTYIIAGNYDYLHQILEKIEFFSSPANAGNTSAFLFNKKALN